MDYGVTRFGVVVWNRSGKEGKNSLIALTGAWS